MIGVVTHGQLAAHHFRSFHGRILHPVGGRVQQRFLRRWFDAELQAAEAACLVKDNPSVGLT